MASATPTSVVIYGCGRMGEAILSGWLASDEGPARSFDQESFLVLERTPERAHDISCAYSVRTISDLSEAHDPDMVILAVKPQSFAEVLPDLRHLFAEADEEEAPLVVSIAAGIPTADIEEGLGSNARVVRVMPNLPLQVGAGASVVAGGARASQDDVDLVRDLFFALGDAHVVDEDQIDAVCAISGGGPAYFAYLVELLRDAGVEAGLDADLAESLAQMTLYGTGRVLQETEQDATGLRNAVCSPGGTTLAALGAMDEHGIREAVKAGVDGAIARAEELATC